MAMGPQMAQTEPAAIVTIGVGTNGPGGIDRTEPPRRLGHGVGRHERRCWGMRGLALPQGARRFVGEARKGLRLARAVALGCERPGRGRGDRSTHAGPGPDEMEDAEKPDECEQDELREAMM